MVKSRITELWLRPQLYLGALVATLLLGVPSLLWRYLDYGFGSGRRSVKINEWYFPATGLDVEKNIIMLECGLMFVGCMFAVWITLKTALDRNTKLKDAPKSFVIAALKALTICSLTSCLFHGRPQTLFQTLDLAATSVAAVVFWIWIRHDKRRPTYFRVLCLIALAYFSVFNAIELDRASRYFRVQIELHNEFSPYIEDRVIAYFQRGVAMLAVLLAIFCGFVSALIFAKHFETTYPTSHQIAHRPLIGQLRVWIVGIKWQWRQFILGTVGAALLIMCICAQNSQLYRPYSLISDHRYNGQHLPASGIYFQRGAEGDDLTALFFNRLTIILDNFDVAALMSGINGLALTLPYFAGALALLWIASRFAMTGILPVLFLGGTVGYWWSKGAAGHYHTPFIDFTITATLLGMIVAACFGAAANLTQARFAPNAN